MTITVKCYGELKNYNTKEEAMKFFLECMAWSEGSERDRYSQIFTQLARGLEYCSDEINNYTTLYNMQRMLKGE